MSSTSTDRVLDFDIPARPSRRPDTSTLRETTTQFVESAMMVRDLDPSASDRDRAIAAIEAFTWAQRLLHQVAEGLAYAA